MKAPSCCTSEIKLEGDRKLELETFLTELYLPAASLNDSLINTQVGVDPRLVPIMSINWLIRIVVAQLVNFDNLNS